MGPLRTAPQTAEWASADGAPAPGFMVRKGNWKYICCEGDPPMLFDLAADPDETRNLAGTPGAAAAEAELAALAARHWDAAALKKEMKDSARRRLFLHETRMAAGAPAWDYQPQVDATKQYVRGGGPGATAVKGKARYPAVAPKPPDRPSS